jgi:hypothetical protein
MELQKTTELCCFWWRRGANTTTLFHLTMVLFVPASDFLALGLGMNGADRWEKHKPEIQEEDFRAFFGASSLTFQEIWNDLRNAANVDARLGNKARPLDLLLSFRWMKSYHTEKELAKEFTLSEKTVRKITKKYTRKIHLLKADKVSDGRLRLSNTQPLNPFIYIATLDRLTSISTLRMGSSSS